MYVGQTVRTLESRWKKHLKYVAKGGDGYLQHAIRKYGPDVFVREIIDEAYSKEELDYLEKYYIDELKTMSSQFGYNLAFNAPRGKEGIRKASEKQLGELNHYYKHELKNEELVQLYQSGMSLSRIAKKFNTTRCLVKRRLNSEGIEVVVFPNKKILPEDDICSEYLAGVTQKNLGLKYGVRGSVIRDLLIRNNVALKSIPSRTGENSFAFRLDAPTALLVEDYKAGLSGYALAEKYNLGTTTVRRRLKQAGINFK